MKKNRVSNDEEHHTAYHVKGGICDPENSQQPDVFEYAATMDLGRLNRPKQFFPALTAKPLTGLQGRTTSIAEHLHCSFSTRANRYLKIRILTAGSSTTAAKTKRPPGNVGSLLFQGRIVPTEVKAVKTFWRNLMGRKTGVSRNFYEINIFIFNSLQIM
jgi:hypothetical protein